VVIYEHFAVGWATEYFWLCIKGACILFEGASKKCVKVAVGICGVLRFAHIYPVLLYKGAYVAAGKRSFLPPATEVRREWVVG
jgi:hypothetical protein